ncbi:ROK family protein [Oricola sp.]|uniref:ROK family protein n=1 Tax=Oricola sp. TaxID=1979950 RepID=UPI003BA8BA13
MTMVLRSDDMRRRNRLTILQVARRSGAISRSEIAQKAELSPATVSTITNGLIAEGVLISGGGENTAPAGRGRPSIALRMNPDFRHAILLILKIGAITVAVADYAGDLVVREEHAFDMASVDRETFRATLSEHIRAARKAAGLDEDRLAHIAVAVQGTTDIGGTRMLWSPITPLKDVPIGEWLETEFQVPVRLSNDCDLIAKALNWREPERYKTNFAAILLAHGVGMGLFLRGQVINGTRSSGTEFGHMVHAVDGDLCRCGSRGCVEAYAGDYAIIRRYRGEHHAAPPASPVDREEVETIATAARAGDQRAIETFEAAGRALGSGLAGIFALVDPFRVAFVGHGAKAFDLMEPALRRTLRDSNAVNAETIPIDRFPNVMPLILEGCGIGALAEIDTDHAERIGETIGIANA